MLSLLQQEWSNILNNNQHILFSSILPQVRDTIVGVLD